MCTTYCPIKPTNLCTWQLSEDPLCKLFGKRATLEHVLSACTKVTSVPSAYSNHESTWSQTKKTVVLIELALQYEETVDEARDRKRLTYQELVEQCHDKEWKIGCFPVSWLSLLPGTVCEKTLKYQSYSLYNFCMKEQSDLLLCFHLRSTYTYYMSNIIQKICQFKDLTSKGDPGKLYPLPRI